jgi:hypothetical protein
MKKYLIRLAAAFALLTAFVVGGCTHPVTPREADLPAGKGVVRVAAAVEGPGGARTVMPSAAEGFSRYEYWFAKDGADAAEAIPVEGRFELDPGEYTVMVKAFAPEGTEAAAQGTSAAFAIAAGADAGSVTVTLAPVVAAGEGTLAFTLTYPKDATLESLTLTRLAGAETIDLGSLGSELTTPSGGTFSGEKTGIGAGYYLARATLKKGAAYTGNTEVAHIYNGAVTALNWVFDESHFTGIPVVSSADSGPGTLRSALVYAMEKGVGLIFIDLPDDDKVITLTSPLPYIATQTITIEGGGATLTQEGFEPTLLTLYGPDTNLLAITSTEAVVTIRRLHFKGGRVKGYGGAIYNEGNLTLESCIFSDNRQLQPQPTNPASGDNLQAGGAVWSGGPLTVRGCTFYSNVGGAGGGAIAVVDSTIYQTGNLFFGNIITVDVVTSNDPWNLVLHGSSTTTSLYNVTNKTRSISPTFKPITGSPAATALTALPEEYPAVDFDGIPIPAGGAAGARQTLTVNTAYLDYGMNDSERGTVSSPSPAPDEDGLYASGTPVTLTAATAPGVAAFRHWTVDGVDSTGETVSITMNGHKTARAVFARTVSDTGDTAGTAQTPTLRYALTNLVDDDLIILPEDGTIRLTSELPRIERSMTIEGNGATLTRASSYTDVSASSQLLETYASGLSVTIRRLHFKGGRAQYNGGAIHNRSNLTLESCIFSDNQTTDTTSGGGAVYNAGGALTVRGCTFYDNHAAYRGGAIYRSAGTVVLTGNLFFANTAGNTSPSNVVYGSSVTSGGYNVSDKATGTNVTTGSGYASATGDVFDIAALPLSLLNFKPLSGSQAAAALTTLPAEYPAWDFYGAAITATGAAGAVQTPTQNTGFSLDYGVNVPDRGTVSPSPDPDTDGLYASNANVTLTAAATGADVTFSHWTIDGASGGSSNPLSITMNAPKTVRAVFARSVTVNDTGDTAGSGSTITLRYALTNAQDDDVITLPASGTISLTSALPPIARNLTIEGNGATLTQSGSFQFLFIYYATANIRRLHFMGGRITTIGGAIRNLGTLTLESCIFSDNQTTSTVSGSGGAVYTNGNLTVRGCTFYNNSSAYRGGAIYRDTAGTVILEGNLFSGNTAVNSGYVVYVAPAQAAAVTSGGYNVSDKAAGAVSASDTTNSGYASATGDLFSVTDIVFATNGDPTTKPSSGSNLKTLTSLPAGFPTTYFDGTPRSTIPATAGAVSAD